MPAYFGYPGTDQKSSVFAKLVLFLKVFLSRNAIKQKTDRWRRKLAFGHTYYSLLTRKRYETDLARYLTNFFQSHVIKAPI
jgi:hypothetical protein